MRSGARRRVGQRCWRWSAPCPRRLKHQPLGSGSGNHPSDSGLTTIVPAATAADTLTQLVRPVGAPRVGEALGLATTLAHRHRAVWRVVRWIPDQAGSQHGTSGAHRDDVRPVVRREGVDQRRGQGQRRRQLHVRRRTTGWTTLAFDGLQLRSVTGASPAQGAFGHRECGHHRRKPSSSPPGWA